MASSVTEEVSPPPLSPVLPGRDTARPSDNFLPSHTEEKEDQPFSSRRSPCHVSSSSYPSSADNYSDDADSSSKRRAVCPVFVPSLRLSEADLSRPHHGREDPVVSRRLFSASSQSQGIGTPLRTSSSGSGVSGSFDSPPGPVSSRRGRTDVPCSSQSDSPFRKDANSLGVCTAAPASAKSHSAVDSSPQCLWVAIPLTSASSRQLSPVGGRHLTSAGSSGSPNESPSSAVPTRLQPAEAKVECTYASASEAGNLDPGDAATLGPTRLVTCETVSHTLQEVLRRAPTSAFRSAVESGVKTSLICRIDPLVCMDYGGGGSDVTGNCTPSSSLRSLVQRQRVVLLGTSASPSSRLPGATKTGSPALSPSSPLSLESLLREVKASEEERSTVEVLREQNRKLEELLGKTASQGELKRDLWRLQLLQIQQQSQLRKQTAKMAEALDACRSLLSSIPSVSSSTLPVVCPASSRRIDSRQGENDASNFSQSEDAVPEDSVPSKGPSSGDVASVKLRELLSLIQDAVNLGCGGGGVAGTGTGGVGNSTNSEGGGGDGGSSSQGREGCARREGGDGRLNRPLESSSTHLNLPPVSSVSSSGSFHHGKSEEGGGGQCERRTEEDSSVSGRAQRNTPRQPVPGGEADQRHTPSSYNSSPQGGEYGKVECSASPSSRGTATVARPGGGGVPPLAMGFLKNQHTYRSGTSEREGALSPALSRDSNGKGSLHRHQDYGRRFSSRASFSSSVSLTNNSCSSLCTSRSDLSTYRGNNNFSGDEAGGGEGVLRRRERHSSAMTTPSHREKANPSTTFVSKWKGRPVFVPRLNLTGEDDDEEEEQQQQGGGGGGGEVETSSPFPYPERGASTGMDLDAGRDVRDQGGGGRKVGEQDDCKRGEQVGRGGTVLPTDSTGEDSHGASNSRAAGQRRRETSMKGDVVCSSPTGKNQQVVGGPGGGSAKIEATWRLQQHLLQQRHLLHKGEGSPGGRGAESLWSSFSMAGRSQSSQGKHMVSLEESHSTDTRNNTSPIPASSPPLQERGGCHAEEGERASSKGRRGQGGGGGGSGWAREHGERYKRQGDGLDEQEERRTHASCSASPPSPCYSGGLSPRGRSPSMQGHHSHTERQRVLVSPLNESSRHDSRYTYSCSSHSSSGRSTYRQSDHHRASPTREESDGVNAGNLPHGGSEGLVGAPSQRRPFTGSISSSSGRSNKAQGDCPSYSRATYVTSPAGADAVGGGRALCSSSSGLRQSVTSPADRSPVSSSPSSFKTCGVTRFLSPSATAFSPPPPLYPSSISPTAGGSPSSPLAGHSQVSCKLQVQGQRCFFDPASPLSSAKSTESPPGSPGGRRWPGLRATAPSPPPPPPLVPCSPPGKATQAYVSSGISCAGSLSPLGSSGSPFSPCRQSLSACGGGGCRPTSPIAGRVGATGGMAGSPPRSGSRGSSGVCLRSARDPRNISVASAVSAGVAASAAVAVAAATRQRSEGEDRTRNASSPRMLSPLIGERNDGQGGSASGRIAPPGKTTTAHSSSSHSGPDALSSVGPRGGERESETPRQRIDDTSSSESRSMVPLASPHGVTSESRGLSHPKSSRVGEESCSLRGASGRTDGDRARTPRTHEGDPDPDTPCMNLRSTLRSAGEPGDPFRGEQKQTPTTTGRNVDTFTQKACSPSRDQFRDRISLSRDASSDLRRDSTDASAPRGSPRQSSPATKEAYSRPAGRGEGVTGQTSDNSGRSAGLPRTLENSTRGEERRTTTENVGEGGGEQETSLGAPSCSTPHVVKGIQNRITEDREESARSADRKVQTARGGRGAPGEGQGDSGDSSSTAPASGGAVRGSSRFVRSNSFSGGIPDNTNSPQLSGRGDGERGSSRNTPLHKNNSRAGAQSPFSLSSFSSVSVAELRKAFESRQAQHSYKKTATLPSPPSLSRVGGAGGGSRDGRGGSLSASERGKEKSGAGTSHEGTSTRRMLLRSFSSGSSGRSSIVGGGRGSSRSSLSSLPQGRGRGEGEDKERGDRGRGALSGSSYPEDPSRRTKDREDDRGVSASLSSSSGEGGRDDFCVDGDHRQGQRAFISTGQVSRMVLSLSSTSKSSQLEDDHHSRSSNSRLDGSKSSQSSREGTHSSGCDEEEEYLAGSAKKVATKAPIIKKPRCPRTSNSRSADTRNTTSSSRSHEVSPRLKTGRVEGRSSSGGAEGMLSISISTSFSREEAVEQEKKTEDGAAERKRDNGDDWRDCRFASKKETDTSKEAVGDSFSRSDGDDDHDGGCGERSVPAFTRQALFGEEGDGNFSTSHEKKRREQGGRGGGKSGHDDDEAPHTQRRRRPDDPGDPEPEERLHKKKGRRLEEKQKRDDCREGLGGRDDDTRENERAARYEGTRASEGKEEDNADLGRREAQAPDSSSSLSSLSSGEVRLPHQDTRPDLSFPLSSCSSSGESSFSSSSAGSPAESCSSSATSQGRHSSTLTQPGSPSHSAVEGGHAVVPTSSSSSTSLLIPSSGEARGTRQDSPSSQAKTHQLPPRGEETQSLAQGSPSSVQGEGRARHRDHSGPMAYYVLATTAGTRVSGRLEGVDIAFTTGKEGEEEEVQRAQGAGGGELPRKLPAGGGALTTGGEEEGVERWWEGTRDFSHVDILQHRERLQQLGVDPGLVLRREHLSSSAGDIGGFADHQPLSSQYDSMGVGVKPKRREGLFSSLPTATTTDSFDVDGGASSSLAFASKREPWCHDDDNDLVKSSTDQSQTLGGTTPLFASPPVPSGGVVEAKHKEDGNRVGPSSEGLREGSSVLASAVGGESCCDHLSVQNLPITATAREKDGQNRRMSSEIAITTLSTISTEESLRDLPRIRPTSTTPTPTEDAAGEEGEQKRILEKPVEEQSGGGRMKGKPPLDDAGVGDALMRSYTPSVVGQNIVEELDLASVSHGRKRGTTVESSARRGDGVSEETLSRSKDVVSPSHRHAAVELTTLDSMGRNALAYSGLEKGYPTAEALQLIQPCSSCSSLHGEQQAKGSGQAPPRWMRISVGVDRTLEQRGRREEDGDKEVEEAEEEGARRRRRPSRGSVVDVVSLDGSCDEGRPACKTSPMASGKVGKTLSPCRRLEELREGDEESSSSSSATERKEGAGLRLGEWGGERDLQCVDSYDIEASERAEIEREDARHAGADARGRTTEGRFDEQLKEFGGQAKFQVSASSSKSPPSLNPGRGEGDTTSAKRTLMREGEAEEAAPDKERKEAEENKQVDDVEKKFVSSADAVLLHGRVDTGSVPVRDSASYSGRTVSDEPSSSLFPQPEGERRTSSSLEKPGAPCHPYITITNYYHQSHVSSDRHTAATGQGARQHPSVGLSSTASSDPSPYPPAQRYFLQHGNRISSRTGQFLDFLPSEKKEGILAGCDPSSAGRGAAVSPFSRPSYPPATSPSSRVSGERRTSLPDGLASSTIQHQGRGLLRPPVLSLSSGTFWTAPPPSGGWGGTGVIESVGLSFRQDAQMRSQRRDPLGGGGGGGAFSLQGAMGGAQAPRPVPAAAPPSVLPENVALPPLIRCGYSARNFSSDHSPHVGIPYVYDGRSHTSPTSTTTTSTSSSSSSVRTHFCQPPRPYANGLLSSTAFQHYPHGRPSPSPCVQEVTGGRSVGIGAPGYFPSDIMGGRTETSSLVYHSSVGSGRPFYGESPPQGSSSVQATGFRHPFVPRPLFASATPAASSSSFRRVSDLLSCRRPQHDGYVGRTRPHTASGAVSGSGFCKPWSSASYTGLSRPDVFSSGSPFVAAGGVSGRGSSGLGDQHEALLSLLFASPPVSSHSASHESLTSVLRDTTSYRRRSGRSDGISRRGGGGGADGLDSLLFSEVSSCVSSLESEAISLAQETRDLSSSPREKASERTGGAGVLGKKRGDCGLSTEKTLATGGSLLRKRNGKSPSRCFPSVGESNDTDRHQELSPPSTDKDSRRDHSVRPPQKTAADEEDRSVAGPSASHGVDGGGSNDAQQNVCPHARQDTDPHSGARHTDGGAGNSLLAGNGGDTATVGDRFSYLSSFASRSRDGRKSGISVRITPSVSMAVDVVARVDIASVTPGPCPARHSWSVPPPRTRRRRPRRSGKIGRGRWKVACGEFYGMEEEEDDEEARLEDSKTKESEGAGLSATWNRMPNSSPQGLDVSWFFPPPPSSAIWSTGRPPLLATEYGGQPPHVGMHKDMSPPHPRQGEPLVQQSLQHIPQSQQRQWQTPFFKLPPYDQQSVSSGHDGGGLNHAECARLPKGFFPFSCGLQQEHRCQATSDQSGLFHHPSSASHSEGVVTQPPRPLPLQPASGVSPSTSQGRLRVLHGETPQPFPPSQLGQLPPPLQRQNSNTAFGGGREGGGGGGEGPGEPSFSRRGEHANMTKSAGSCQRERPPAQHLSSQFLGRQEQQRHLLEGPSRSQEDVPLTQMAGGAVGFCQGDSPKQTSSSLQQEGHQAQLLHQQNPQESVVGGALLRSPDAAFAQSWQRVVSPHSGRGLSEQQLQTLSSRLGTHVGAAGGVLLPPSWSSSSQMAPVVSATTTGALKTDKTSQEHEPSWRRSGGNSASGQAGDE